MAAVATSASATDPCGPGANPIVCENSKPGTPGWDIWGAGSDELQGFATDISVDAGSPISFKIDTTSSDYDIEIFRTGYYQGIGAREIASIKPSAPLPQVQPQCVWDVTTELTDCGNWAVSATWNVPDDAVSGVYVADLSDDAHSWYSQILFVVRNDSSHSDLVFQTSDTTWQAYNTYGGSDFYQGAANGRAYKISYNRPLVTRAGTTNHDNYFSSEYAMVRFLERNGYDVTYVSGVDTDRSGGLLLNHKTFLSVGHDEYWSGQQRANVEAARDAGVNLAFFSGNEVYWHTRLEPSVAGTPTDDRTIVSYKETWSNADIDPADEWSGTWRDPRFASVEQGAGEPENGLTGTMYMSNSSDLPVTVSSAEGKLRLWRNTAVASLPAGATKELAPHTVGYESDEDPDNGFRPAGLIDLSTTVAPVEQYMQDFGNVVLPGTTTHHITEYRVPSGALVFSAGSIQWSWGLDQTHDGDGAPADVTMQQATVNLLADMDAQPDTLMAGLVTATKSTDTTGPTVTITSPAAGATIANGTPVTATGTATDAAGRVAVVEVSTDGGTTWQRATGTTSWSYSYVQTGTDATPLEVRAADDSANLGATVTQTATVTCPCSVYGATVPVTAAADDPSALELGLKFTPTQDGYVTAIRFYKGAGNTGTHTGTLWTAGGEALAHVVFSNETDTGWQSATLDAPAAVSAGTTYVVSYTAPSGHYSVQPNAFWYRGLAATPLTVPGGFGANDSGVFGVPGQFPTQSWNSSQYYVDVTFSASDDTPLTIGQRLPLPGAASIAPSTTVSAVFSRPITTGSASVTVTSADGSTMAGATAYDPSTRTVTFTPSAALAPATSYTATVSASANGSGVSGTPSWSFRTAAADQQPGAQTVSLYDESATPSVLEAADSAAVTLGVRFSSSVDGVVTGVRFYKGPDNTGPHVGALWAVGGSQPLAQATFTNESTSGWQTVTFATPVRITKDTEYIASYRTTVGMYSVTLGAFSGVGLDRDPLHTTADSGAFTYSDGYPGSSTSSSYLVDVVFVRDAASLAVTSQSPAPNALGADPAGPVTVAFSAPLADGADLALLTSSGDAVTGTTTRSADGTTLTFTPSSALGSGLSYTATATGLVSTSGATLADVTWSFATATATGCPCTLFGSATPQQAAADDGAAVELGVSFIPTTDGEVTGVRFYKGAGNDGTHTGTLWSSDGTALRTVTFTGESANGWQTATFGSPYPVTAGTTYVVSYFAPNGHYAVTQQAFAADVHAGSLTVPAAGNGRYRYGGGFPADSWMQSNYFVDVVFTVAAPTPPTVTPVTPAAGSTGVPVGTTVSATLSKAPTSGTPTIVLTTASGTVAGTSAYDGTSHVVTFTPAAALPYDTVISVATLLAGDPLAGGAWTFHTEGPPDPSVPVRLWNDSDVPAQGYDDPFAVELGTRFTTSAAGSLTAVRFYKSPADAATTHVVNVYDPDGTLIASASSSSETASGWQTVALPSPVALTTGAVYRATFESSGGHYLATSGGLAVARVVGPLTAVGSWWYYPDVYGSPYGPNDSTTWYGVDVAFLPSS